MTPLPWRYDDGGRTDAGFRGDAGDCVTRALAIASGRPYRDVYDALAARMALRGRPRSARNGVPRVVYDAVLGEWGAEWTPTMRVGEGCRVHLRVGEVPMTGALVVRLSRHLSAVVDGVVLDTYDPGRDGTRCVYGYWTLRERGR